MYSNIFSVIFIAVILGAQIVRSFLGERFKIADFLRTYELRIHKSIFLFSIFVIFLLLFYQSYLQYQVWLSDELSKNFLEASVKIDSLNINISYFIFYVVTRFFAPYFISLAAALIFFIFAKKLNKRYNEKFFEPEELYLGALALFLTSWPGAMFYFIGLILIYLLIHFLLLVISHKSLVVSLYYLWMPTAIFVILINKWLSTLPLWKMMIF